MSTRRFACFTKTKRSSCSTSRPVADSSLRPIQSQHAAIDFERRCTIRKSCVPYIGSTPTRRESLSLREHATLPVSCSRNSRREVLRRSIWRASKAIRRRPCLHAMRQSEAARRNLAAAPSTTRAHPARTEFRVLHKFADGTSLVEARPITGRTNQIRVHLWHLGWPILGEQAYLANQQLGETQTHATCDPPLCLHAHRIAFDHPLTAERSTFECDAPSWAQFDSGPDC